MKKIAIIIAALSSIALTGCLKDTPHTDFTKTGATAEILYSGIEYFSNTSPQGQSYALNFNADTLTYDIIVNINSDYPLTTDTKVTLGVDDGARTAYNSANSTNYVLMPAAVYSFPVTTGTIKAGTRQLHFSLQFFKAAFDSLTDPTQSYMAPISLTDASGVLLASNFSTIYPHSIGNPFAGAYNWSYNRYNAGDTTGAVTTHITGTQLFVPDDPNTVEVQSGYGKQNAFNYRYVVTFNGGSGGVPITNLAVVINPSDVSSVLTNNGITLVQAAKIVYADPVNRVFEFTYGVTNGSGAPRTFTDTYIHQ